MNQNEFLSVVRHGCGKFRADNIVVATGRCEYRGKGVLQVEANQFQLFVTLSEPATETELATGIVNQKDFWNIRGVTEDEIEFRMHTVPDGTSHSSTFGRGENHILEFSSSGLELPPCGLDCLTDWEKYQMLHAGSTNLGAITEAVEKPTHSAHVLFRAVLPKFRLIDHNGSTHTTIKNAFLGEHSRSRSDTYYGDVAGWQFGLIEREGDLHVHFVSKPEHVSNGEQHDWHCFNAFLHAVAFMHGQHAWPFSVEYRRDGKLLLNRIQLSGEVAATPHAPFTKALAFENAVKGSTWSFREALEKAFLFFSTRSQLAHECENLLYLLREASSCGVPRRITLLSFCSLLESLVRAVYHEQIEPQKIVETTDFQNAKKQILEELQERKQPGMQRLIAILSNAEPINTRLRFAAVVEHLRLMPQDYWRELYDLWSKFRNPLSHRMSESESSTEALNEDLIAESRIAGAINCIILKLMNYTGPARLSTYEGKYTRL